MVWFKTKAFVLKKMILSLGYTRQHLQFQIAFAMHVKLLNKKTPGQWAENSQIKRTSRFCSIIMTFKVLK